MKNHTYFLLISLLLIIFSCKPQVPGKYIQPDDFEDILYDYHLADAIVNNDGTDEKKYELTLYRQAVLKKYDITQAEFDSSLVYYVRHADRLHKIYENLSKRLSDEALALGATANDISKYGDLASVKDTSNMWRGVSSCILMPQAPYNTMSFDITADSTYHKGDKLIFSFNSNFIFKDGTRDGVAMLAVQFKNDSIGSSVIHMSSNNNYSITVADTRNNGIKAIRGFIYLNKPYSNQANNSLNLMAINKIKLVRMRNNNSNPASSGNSSSVNSKDSMPKRNMSPASKRPDSANNVVTPQSGRSIPPTGKTNAPVLMNRISPQLNRLPAK